MQGSVRMIESNTIIDVKLQQIDETIDVKLSDVVYIKDKVDKIPNEYGIGIRISEVL